MKTNATNESNINSQEKINSDGPLSPLEAKVLLMRYGVYENQDPALSAVAEVLSLSTEQVLKTERCAIMKLITTKCPLT